MLLVSIQLQNNLLITYTYSWFMKLARCHCTLYNMNNGIKLQVSTDYNTMSQIIFLTKQNGKQLNKSSTKITQINYIH